LTPIAKTFIKKQALFLLFIPVVVGIFFVGCSLEKKNGFDRSMQNLTAHYNILFDANQILLQKQADYALGFIDSYNEVLSVYPDTALKAATTDKDLQAAIDKANKIINIKEQSHYIGDAYLVLGKANYLAGDYFDAAEYFTYVINNFPKQVKLVQEALVWKARTLIYLGHLPAAKATIDTAIQNINPKKSIDANIYATKLQYDIDAQEYADGEDMAKLAIEHCHDNKQRLRWSFILAQLEELNQHNDAAITNYAHIAKSNAVFEMAFNAQLNLIRIQDQRDGVKASRADELKRLLKNPNNKDFKDQIYYQIAQLYLIDKDYDNAIKYYKLSIRSSVKNQNQKGLSYLRIADINFDPKANYVIAKKYYDSTLTTLSPNYPGYVIIQKKTNNLKLLTDRLQIIAREDTLQMLAKLDDKTRSARIDTIVKREIAQDQAAAKAAAAVSAANNAASGGDVFAAPGQSTFYFYNSNAVSQGFTDFKRIWGNRKLEDNWRRANRSGSDQTASSTNTAKNIDPGAKSPQTTKSANSVEFENKRQDIIQNLPLTADQLAQSNLRVFNAYFDIANFYRDILEDKKGAIGFYELLLKRFPNNPNQAAIYYSLYRLHSELNDGLADTYKDKLLKDYADTPFAKVILDPDYSKKMGDRDAQFNTTYNSVYDLYAQKKYDKVITRADSVLTQYPNNKYAAQLGYLRTIAKGHQEPVDSFKTDLQSLLTKYPNDKLITPLVKQHIDYITANLVDMSARHNALLATDPAEIPFTPPIENQEQTPYRKLGVHRFYSSVPDVRKPEKKPEPVKKEPEKTVAKTDSAKKSTVPGVAKADAITQANANLPITNPDSVAPPPVIKKAVISSIFSLRDSTEYFFVVNIANDNTNLSSSRFGIGQFNRGNAIGYHVRHQLLQIGDNNRLIYVGMFGSLAEVKNYARAIIPLMPEIMKVPKDKYSFFIITNGNLDKITNKARLDSYLDYYQSTY
jgi:tetratricopeptide (TPR) repeat protein